MSDQLTTPAKAQFGAAILRYRKVALVVAVTFIHLLIAASSVGPMYLLDEVGYLAAAETFGRGETEWALCGESYSVGWSLLLAPLWWLPLSPVMIYQVAAFMSAAIGAAVMWPSSLIARKAGATPGVALAIGALVTLVPTRALMNNYVIAENLLTFAIACSVLFALRLHAHGALGTHLAFGLSMGAAALVHSRAIPFVMVGVAWMIVRALVRSSSFSKVIAGAIPAMALAAVGFVSQMAVGAALFTNDERIDKLLGGRDIVDVALVFVGQSFSHVVSWSIFAVLGAITVVTLALRIFKASRRGALSSPYLWWALAFGAQAAFTVFVLTGFDSIDTRLDVPLYGRYLDPFLVPLAVVGAVALISRAKGRAPRVALFVALSAIGLYLLTVLPFIADDAAWINFATPGFLPFLDPYEGPKHLGLLLAAGVSALSCVVMYLSRRRAVVLLPIALVVAAGATLTTDIARLDPFESNVRTQTPISKLVEANSITPDVATLSPTMLPCAERNKLQYELASSTSIVPEGAPLGPGIAVGPAEWSQAEAAGFTRVLFTVWEHSAIWAMQTEQ